jgi:MFS transporter, DHA1 family, inner membrane transport protein
MGALILAASLLMPLATIFSPAAKRTRLLTAVLFCLAVCSCLCAINPAFGTVFDLPSFSLSLHPALLHPVLLAGAVSSGGVNEGPVGLPWQGTSAARSALFGLVLGLPMATWLSTKVPQPVSFVAAAYLTAAIGIWMMLRHRRRSPAHAAVTEMAPVRLTGVIWVSLAAIALQYAAMFSVFSNSLHLLTDQPAIDFPFASLLMVLFGFGGIAGALLAGGFLRKQPALTALIHPIALASVYVLLYLFAHGPDALTAVAVLSWGAAHSGGMLVTQSTLRSLAPETPDVMTALHVCAGSVGVLAGVAVAAAFASALGSTGFLLCGVGLAICSLAAVGTQLSRMDLDAPIVARDSTD